MSPTARTTAQRYPERVTYDREAAYAILDEARRPSTEEARYTAVLTMPIEEFSIKTRSGFARDEPKDDAVEAWAGFIPYATTTGAPVPDAVTGTRFPAPDPALLDRTVSRAGRAGSRRPAAG